MYARAAGACGVHRSSQTSYRWSRNLGNLVREMTAISNGLWWWVHYCSVTSNFICTLWMNNPSNPVVSKSYSSFPSSYVYISIDLSNKKELCRYDPFRRIRRDLITQPIVLEQIFLGICKLFVANDNKIREHFCEEKFSSIHSVCVSRGTKMFLVATYSIIGSLLFQLLAVYRHGAPIASHFNLTPSQPSSHSQQKNNAYRITNSNNFQLSLVYFFYISTRPMLEIQCFRTTRCPRVHSCICTWKIECCCRLKAPMDEWL